MKRKAITQPPEPRKRGDWLPIYKDKIEAMKPAETIRFSPVEHGVDLADRDSFRASIASYARRFHAGGKTTCAFNHMNGMVELSRIE